MLSITEEKKIKLIGILNVFKHVLKFNSDSYFFSNLTLPLVDFLLWQ